MKNNEAKKKLDIDDRMTIQGCLHKKYTVIKISEILKVHKTTIYRELARNSRFVESKVTKFDVCKTRNRLIVCNTCIKKAYCNKNKFYYDYKYAQELTDNRRKTSRCHPRLPLEKIKTIDEIVYAGVNLGQSLHHIYVSNSVLKKICSEKTIRRLVYRGNLSIRPSQLRKYVVYKREYKKDYDRYRINNISAVVGRNFKDFKRTCASNKRMNVVQYDSVIGKTVDKKAILTITFPKYNFQFGILINKGSPSSVRNNLTKLFRKIGRDNVKKIFPINLCDNGVEFSRFYEIEYDSNGEQLSRTFYTNPYRSTDKAECERNHVFIRYCIPKSKSLDHLTQDVINDMFSNINSYVRGVLNDKTPYELVEKKFGKEFLDTIGIRKIPKKKVKLTQIV